MQPPLLLSLLALAAKTGEGEKKQPLLPMPPPPPTGGMTLQKLKSSTAAITAATSTLTGPHVMGRTMCKDDVKTGVSLTTTMMTTEATTSMTTTGGAVEMPGGVGDEFESPLERDLAEFDPSGVAVSPPLGLGLARGESECQRQGWTIIAIPMGKN
jgi:hypothetical protein